MSDQPASWGEYPEPHYDEYDDCLCPDHVAMRAAASQSALRTFIERMTSDEQQ